MNKYALTSIDDAGITELNEIYRTEVGGKLGEYLIETANLAEAAIDTPGNRFVEPNAETRRMRKHLPAVEKVMRRVRASTWEEIREFSSRFEPSLLLGAAAALSQVSRHSAISVEVPGKFTHEIDILATAGRWPDEVLAVPGWGDVAQGLRLARRWRLATLEIFDGVSDYEQSSRAERAKADLRSVTGAYWHSVNTGEYDPIVSEILRNLHSSLPGSVSSAIANVSPSLQLLLDCLGQIVEAHAQPVIAAKAALSLDAFVDSFTQAHSVTSASELLCATGKDLRTVSLVPDDFVWNPKSGRQSSASKDENPLLVKPFIYLNGRPMLIAFRRLTTERLDFIDRATMQACGLSSGQTESRYAKARADVLDRLVAMTLEEALPGCDTYTGVIPLDRNEPEQDVVCRYQDIAMAVETKGAPLKESALRGAPSLIDELKKKTGTGGKQAVRAAAVLLANTPLRLNANKSIIPLSTAPARVYAICVSFATPWPVDVSVQQMLDADIIQDGNVCFTSIDKFMLMRRLFSTPAEFLAFYDFRLSVQRRPWLQLPDEYETAGFFCNQTLSRWLRPTEAALTIKNIAQPSFNAFVANLARGVVSRPEGLRRRDHSFVSKFLKELEEARPPRWLLASSAALRTPLDAQQWIADTLSNGPRVLMNRRYVHLPLEGGLITLTLVAAAVDHGLPSFRAQMARATRGSLISWVIRTGPFFHQVIGIKGVDDDDVWWQQAGT